QRTGGLMLRHDPAGSLARRSRRNAPQVAALILLVLTLSALPAGGRPASAGSADFPTGADAHSVGAAPEAQGARLQGDAMGFFRQTLGGPCPTTAQIDEDLRHVDQGHLANAIRFYGQTCNLDQVPGRVQAVAPSLSVYSGVACQTASTVSQEITTMAANANTYTNVKAAVICNEPSNAQPPISATTLATYLTEAKGQITRSDVTVSVADIWYAWLDSSYQERLGPLVDTLIVH